MAEGLTRGGVFDMAHDVVVLFSTYSLIRPVRDNVMSPVVVY